MTNDHPSSDEFIHFMASRLKGDSRVFEDPTWNHGNCHQQIQAKGPDALFILNVREPRSWVNSFSR